MNNTQKILPSIAQLIKNLLDLTKTETSVLSLLWSHEYVQFKVKKHELNPDSGSNFSSSIKIGLTINQLSEILNLTKSSIQKAVKNLVEKEYLSRKKKGREYFYKTEPKAFDNFQINFKIYQNQLQLYFRPFNFSGSGSEIFRYIRNELAHDWRFGGWLNFQGHQKYVLGYKGKNKLTEDDLKFLNQESDGSEITSDVAKAIIGEFTVIETNKPFTSPLHLESLLLQNVWHLNSRVEVR